nr:MAG TPA: hypothetical protein [Caudoviricetes sp.]
MSSSEAPDAATAEVEEMEEVHDSMAVAIAERYLADAAKHSHDWHYPKPEGKTVPGDWLDEEEGFARLIDTILEYATKTENTLLRDGAVVDMDFEYATALSLTKDGMTSGRGVKLNSNRLGWSVVELSVDTVRRIAYFCQQRPLVDRIRVYGQLVHYFHGLLGPWKCVTAGVPNEYISGLIIAIELLVGSLKEYHSEGHGVVVKQDQEVS